MKVQAVGQAITSRLALIAFAVVLVLALQPHSLQAQKGKKQSDKVETTFSNRVLWSDPGAIQSRNLLYGPGSQAIAPVPPFTFIKEDKEGESPKLDVRDGRGVLWSVKLGEEAQSETTATRLVWAVGYFAEEAYYFENVKIRKLPEHLSRGDEHVAPGNVLVGARFEPRRAHIKRDDTWDWDKNPFKDTKQLSGLKILMILLNNFDAREANNRILYDKRSATKEALYYVTDLGATLGRAGGLGGKRTKNNLNDFLSTRFVLGIEDGAVEFDYDTRPSRLGHLSVLYPPYYSSQVKKEKSMRGIPVEHARWIGALLSQLTDEQLRDAFRAANYDEEIREGYVRSLRMRIDQLGRL
ncbi:MAG: hypothetical protein M3447_09750 [Acidobacteriota bacterium]|nr:hypothetical protein [Acidobacteriota bacterium]